MLKEILVFALLSCSIAALPLSSAEGVDARDVRILGQGPATDGPIRGMAVEISQIIGFLTDE